MNAIPRRSPRPARPTAWASSWYVRSEARSSGRLSATSAETTPTSVDLGDVEALGHEAGPDEDVGPARGEVVQDPVGGALALDHVAVEAAHPEVREPRPDLALDPLRAAAEVPDPGRAARRAAGRDRPRAAAVVAAERGARLVVHERPVAVGARLDRAAVPAQHHRGRPAAVEDEDRAVAGLRVEAGEGLRERVREQAAVAGRELRAEVDGRDEGLGAGGPHGQDRAPVRAGPGVAHRLDRRGRGAEHHGRARQAGQLQRRVPGLDARRAVALVGGVVLLVDDDQADVRERREQRGAGPHDQVRVAGPDPPPLVGALALAQRGVEHGDPGGQLGTEAVDDGRRQRDLGDQQEGRPARGERGGDGLDVDRGLAAAGHAVEEERASGRWPRGPCVTSASASAWAGVSADPAGRAPRDGAGRSARGRRGRSRTSARTSPRRTRPASDDDPWRSASGPAASPSGACAAPGSGQLRERLPLARTERAPGQAVPRLQRRGRRAPGLGDPQPPLVARTRGGVEQRPGQLDQARRPRAPGAGAGARRVPRGWTGRAPPAPVRPARPAGRRRAAAGPAPRRPAAPRRRA